MLPLYDDVPARRPPLVMVAIIVLNAVVFLWWNGLPDLKQQAVTYQWGFVPARTAQLVAAKPIIVPLKQDDRAWFAPPPPQLVLQPKPSEVLASLITCMFMHGGWLHLLGNMWFLWIFGDNVEDRIGHFPFLALYLAGGFAASAAHWASSPGSLTPVIGASGAVAAVLGAYVITWPWARVYTLVFYFIVELPAFVFLGIWFLWQVFGASRAVAGAGQNVAWWAHVGGFLAGIVLMQLATGMFHGEQRRREPPENDYP